MQVQAWEIEWVTRKVNDWIVKSFLLHLYMPGNCNGGAWKMGKHSRSEAGYFLLLIFSAGIVLTMDRFGDTNLKSQLQGS